MAQHPSLVARLTPSHNPRTAHGRQRVRATARSSTGGRSFATGGAECHFRRSHANTAMAGVPKPPAWISHSLIPKHQQHRLRFVRQASKTEAAVAAKLQKISRCFEKDPIGRTQSTPSYEDCVERYGRARPSTAPESFSGERHEAKGTTSRSRHVDVSSNGFKRLDKARIMSAPPNWLDPKVYQFLRQATDDPCFEALLCAVPRCELALFEGRDVPRRNPYDLVVVSATSKINADNSRGALNQAISPPQHGDYAIFSKHGVMYNCAHGNEFVTLRDWERQARIFHHIAQLSVFRHLPVWRCFHTWQTGLLRRRFSRNKRRLQQNILITNTPIRRAIATVAGELGNLADISFELCYIDLFEANDEHRGDGPYSTTTAPTSARPFEDDLQRQEASLACVGNENSGVSEREAIPAGVDHVPSEKSCHFDVREDAKRPSPQVALGTFMSKIEKMKAEGITIETFVGAHLAMMWRVFGKFERARDSLESALETAINQMLSNENLSLNPQQQCPHLAYETAGRDRDFGRQRSMTGHRLETKAASLFAMAQTGADATGKKLIVAAAWGHVPKYHTDAARRRAVFWKAMRACRLAEAMLLGTYCKVVVEYTLQLAAWHQQVSPRLSASPAGELDEVRRLSQKAEAHLGVAIKVPLQLALTVVKGRIRTSPTHDTLAATLCALQSALVFLLSEIPPLASRGTIATVFAALELNGSGIEPPVLGRRTSWPEYKKWLKESILDIQRAGDVQASEELVHDAKNSENIGDVASQVDILHWTAAKEFLEAKPHGQLHGNKGHVAAMCENDAENEAACDDEPESDVDNDAHCSKSSSLGSVISTEGQEPDEALAPLPAPVVVPAASVAMPVEHASSDKIKKKNQKKKTACAVNDAAKQLEFHPDRMKLSSLRVLYTDDAYCRAQASLREVTKNMYDLVARRLHAHERQLAFHRVLAQWTCRAKPILLGALENVETEAKVKDNQILSKATAMFVELTPTILETDGNEQRWLSNSTQLLRHLDAVVNAVKTHRAEARALEDVRQLTSRVTATFVGPRETMLSASQAALSLLEEALPSHFTVQCVNMTRELGIMNENLMALANSLEDYFGQLSQLHGISDEWTRLEARYGEVSLMHRFLQAHEMLSAQSPEVYYRVAVRAMRQFERAPEVLGLRMLHCKLSNELQAQHDDIIARKNAQMEAGVNAQRATNVAQGSDVSPRTGQLALEDELAAALHENWAQLDRAIRACLLHVGTRRQHFRTMLILKGCEIHEKIGAILTDAESSLFCDGQMSPKSALQRLHVLNAECAEVRVEASSHVEYQKLYCSHFHEMPDGQASPSIAEFPSTSAMGEESSQKENQHSVEEARDQQERAIDLVVDNFGNLETAEERLSAQKSLWSAIALIEQSFECFHLSPINGDFFLGKPHSRLDEAVASAEQVLMRPAGTGWGDTQNETKSGILHDDSRSDISCVSPRHESCGDCNDDPGSHVHPRNAMLNGSQKRLESVIGRAKTAVAATIPLTARYFAGNYDVDIWNRIGEYVKPIETLVREHMIEGKPMSLHELAGQAKLSIRDLEDGGLLANASRVACVVYDAAVSTFLDNYDDAISNAWTLEPPAKLGASAVFSMTAAEKTEHFKKLASPRGELRVGCRACRATVHEWDAKALPEAPLGVTGETQTAARARVRARTATWNAKIDSAEGMLDEGLALIELSGEVKQRSSGDAGARMPPSVAREYNSAVVSLLRGLVEVQRLPRLGLFEPVTQPVPNSSPGQKVIVTQAPTAQQTLRGCRTQLEAAQRQFDIFLKTEALFHSAQPNSDVKDDDDDFTVVDEPVASTGHTARSRQRFVTPVDRNTTTPAGSDARTRSFRLDVDAVEIVRQSPRTQQKTSTGAFPFRRQRNVRNPKGGTSHASFGSLGDRPIKSAAARGASGFR